MSAPTFHSYVPHPARIAAIVPESADTRTFVLALDPPVAALDAARPGQFAMLSLFGFGEAALSLTSPPCAGGTPGTAVLTVRRVGSLTEALFALAVGARVGVRGPFGRGFPEPDGSPAIYVAGGCGLAPLRAAIEWHVCRRRGAAPLAIVYGARDLASRILIADLDRWRRLPGVHLTECVEQADAGFHGPLGTVLEFLDGAVAAVGATRAALCGPSLMLADAATRLVRAGLAPAAIHLAMERYMKCGVGQCGHCYVNDRYVCTDGPVFALDELLRLPDALPPGWPPAGHTVE